MTLKSGDDSLNVQQCPHGDGPRSDIWVVQIGEDGSPETRQAPQVGARQPVPCLERPDAANCPVGVQSVHGAHDGTQLCSGQGERHHYALVKRLFVRANFPVPYDRTYAHDVIRRALERVAKEEGVTPTEWSRKAGCGPSTLPTFLCTPDRTVSMEVIFKLAQAVDRPVEDLLGLKLPTRPALSPEGERALISLEELARGHSEAEKGSSRTIEKIVRALLPPDILLRIQRQEGIPEAKKPRSVSSKNPALPSKRKRR